VPGRGRCRGGWGPWLSATDRGWPGWPGFCRVRHVRGAAAFRADATSIPDGEKLVEFAQKQFGQVDTLVNNAGVYSYVPFVDLTERQWDQMIDINMKGLMFQSQAFVRVLREDDRPGRTINLASIGCR
jgi:NAD(P)-dependent dehydrogenase (short-subunit alcohol dehydrogenase family)